jgi:hypothetical protein
MLKRLSSKERLALLVEVWEPTIRRAFMDAVNSIRSAISIKLLVERLERGDVGGAVDVLRIEQEAFGALDTAIADAFNAGGLATVEDMRLRDPEGHRVRFRWNVRDPESEAWLRRHSAALVTSLTEEQRDNARSILSAGLMRGDNPTRTALDLVGRVSRVTGTRQGGVIGLSAQHLSAVERARAALLSGDVEGMRAYLQLKRRDNRFDASIRKALEAGKGLDRASVDRVTGRLSDSYLKLRADTIALHETFTALGASRDAAFRQAITKGDVDPQLVTKTWRHTTAEHPRMQHVAMAGQTVQFDQPFIAPDGTPIMHPHAEGVPARHTLGCRCRAEYRIDYTGQLLRRRAH